MDILRFIPYLTTGITDAHMNTYTIEAITTGYHGC